MQVILTEKELDTKLADSGHVIDVLALSAGEEEYDSFFNLENVDSAIKYVLDNYNWETSFIENLETGSCNLDIGSFGHRKDFDSLCQSPLKFGAALALADRPAFVEAVTEYENRIRALDRGDSHVPADLQKEMDDAETETMDDDYKSWRDGDRSGWTGIVRLATQKLDVYGLTLKVDEKKNQVVLLIDDDEMAHVAEFVSDYDGFDVAAELTEQRIVGAIAGTVNSRALAYVNERKARMVELRAERERLAAYKAEQAKETEAWRVEKFKSMKK